MLSVNINELLVLRVQGTLSLILWANSSKSHLVCPALTTWNWKSVTLTALCMRHGNNILGLS